MSEIRRALGHGPTDVALLTAVERAQYEGWRRRAEADAAAIEEPRSNGQTEGRITKLKLVKRQMYGRAKLDPLRARLLAAA